MSQLFHFGFDLSVYRIIISIDDVLPFNSKSRNACPVVGSFTRVSLVYAETFLSSSRNANVLGWPSLLGFRSTAATGLGSPETFNKIISTY